MAWGRAEISSTRVAGGGVDPRREPTQVPHRPHLVELVWL